MATSYLSHHMFHLREQLKNLNDPQEFIEQTLWK
jgi:hypothetical protein